MCGHEMWQVTCFCQWKADAPSCVGTLVDFWDAKAFVSTCVVNVVCIWFVELESLNTVQCIVSIAAQFAKFMFLC